LAEPSGWWGVHSHLNKFLLLIPLDLSFGKNQQQKVSEVKKSIIIRKDGTGTGCSCIALLFPANRLSVSTHFILS